MIRGQVGNDPRKDSLPFSLWNPHAGHEDDRLVAQFHAGSRSAQAPGMPGGRSLEPGVGSRHKLEPGRVCAIGDPGYSPRRSSASARNASKVHSQ